MNSLVREINEAQVKPGSLKIWWIGQEGFIFKSATRIIYIDPYLSTYAERITKGKPNEHVLHLNAAPTVERCWRELVAADAENSDGGKAPESLEAFALRFRPNLVVEDAGDGSLKPWSELGWCGRDVRVGPEVVLRINEPTIRCPSTRVRYDTAGDEVLVDEAQLKMPDVALQRAFPSLSAGIFGRETTLAEKGSYLGLYATVIQGGTMSPGDDIVLIG